MSPGRKSSSWRPGLGQWLCLGWSGGSEETRTWNGPCRGGEPRTETALAPVLKTDAQTRPRREARRARDSLRTSRLRLNPRGTHTEPGPRSLRQRVSPLCRAHCGLATGQQGSHSLRRGLLSSPMEAQGWSSSVSLWENSLPWVVRAL